MRPANIDNCFGMYFPGASGKAAAKGVVLCGTFGLEELRHRSSLLALAEALSERGLATLCFDYRGAGESTGSSLDPDILESWQGNVSAACDWMRSHAGMSQVGIGGLRLGAILAARTAAARPDIEDLVLLAPPASGASYVAELLRADEGLQAGRPPALPFDGVDIAGYRLCAATLEELKKFRWDNLAGLAAHRVRILSDARADDIAAMKRAFSTATSDVSIGIFDGFVRGTADSLAAVRPRSLWSQAVELFDIPGKERAHRPAPPPAFLPLSGPGYLETPVNLGPGLEFAGILCQPNGGYETRKVVIFSASPQIAALNWPRLPVELSRRLARQGISSLRLNLPGATGRYAGADALQSFWTIVDWLKIRRYSDLAMVGVTAQDDRTITLAASDQRIDQIFLVDTPLPGSATLAIADHGRAADGEEARDDEKQSEAAAAPGAPWRAAIHATRHGLGSLKDMAGVAADMLLPGLTLDTSLAPYVRSGRPLTLLHLGGAAKSARLTQFMTDSAPSGMRQGVVIRKLDTPAGLLASDREREAFGDMVIGALRHLPGNADARRPEQRRRTLAAV